MKKSLLDADFTARKRFYLSKGMIISRQDHKHCACRIAKI
jgi:hypothetical protein